jgi:glycosyltransferase involved in cell wall biosynthesis
MIDPRQPDFTSTPFSAARAKFEYRFAGSVGPPAVSVITPFHNTGEVFRETARAVLGQSLQNIEWIVVNDASTNAASLAMLDEFRTADARIRVIDLPANVGPGGARNAGVRAARAPFIFQLDADDLIEPVTLEMAAWYLTSHPEASFVKGWTVGFAHKPHLWTRGFHEGPRFLEENLSTITAMVRRDAFLDVGGYDTTIVGGMEDWDLWVRLASRGKWGSTIPQYLDWYRRRPNHADVWHDWDGGDRQQAFHRRLRERCPNLTPENFPVVHPRPAAAFEDLPSELPFRNDLEPRAKRLLLIIPWLTMGGADKFNVRMIEQLVARGWEITVATTLEGDQAWLAQFTRLTPDVFVMPHFLRQIDRPLFLRSLIESRRPEVVMVSNSEMGYQLLPYLRSHCPEPAYVDYCHMEENYWKNGGYPRYAAFCQQQLDLNIVSSSHLKSWMVARGADDSRIEICSTNEDADEWKPDAAKRAAVRAELGIDERTPVLLYAGRICDQKQPRVFAGTILELHAKGLEFVAIVAGDGVDKPMLEEFAARHSIGHHLRFTGAVPNARMKDLAAASDVFFLPSLWEGISLAIFEAMAAGLAIVGGDVGGQRELVTPECGVLVQRSTPEREISAYVEALTPFIADPSHARQVGSRGRARIIDHYQLSHMGDRMEQLLATALRFARSSPRPAIDPALGRELAIRGIEYLRLHSLADALWADRERLRSIIGAPQPSPSPAGGGEIAAENELAAIERSRLYGLVLAAKRTFPYCWLARLRWGPGWEQADRNEPAAARLARLKASRAYRMILRLKRTGPYRLYAIRTYGGLPEVSPPTHLGGVSGDPDRAGRR